MLSAFRESDVLLFHSIGDISFHYVYEEDFQYPEIKPDQIILPLAAWTASIPSECEIV